MSCCPRTDVRATSVSFVIFYALRSSPTLSDLCASVVVTSFSSGNKLADAMQVTRCCTGEHCSSLCYLTASPPAESTEPQVSFPPRLVWSRYTERLRERTRGAPALSTLIKRTRITGSGHTIPLSSSRRIIWCEIREAETVELKAVNVTRIYFIKPRAHLVAAIPFLNYVRAMRSAFWCSAASRPSAWILLSEKNRRYKSDEHDTSFLQSIARPALKWKTREKSRSVHSLTYYVTVKPAISRNH